MGAVVGLLALAIAVAVATAALVLVVPDVGEPRPGGPASLEEYANQYGIVEGYAEARFWSAQAVSARRQAYLTAGGVLVVALIGSALTLTRSGRAGRN